MRLLITNIYFILWFRAAIVVKLQVGRLRGMGASRTMVNSVRLSSSYTLRTIIRLFCTRQSITGTDWQGVAQAASTLNKGVTLAIGGSMARFQ